MAEEGYKKIFWEILLTSVKYSDALTHFRHSPHCRRSSMTRAFLSRPSSSDSAIDRACLENFSAISRAFLGHLSSISRPSLERASSISRPSPRPLLERAPAFLGRPCLGHRSTVPRAFPSRRSSMTRSSLDHANDRACIGHRSSMPRPAMEHASAILYHARAFLPSLEHSSAMLEHARAFLSRRSSMPRPCSMLEHFSRAFNPLFYLTSLASALVLNLLGRTIIFQQIFIDGKFLVAGKFSGGRSPELRRRRGVTGGRSRLVGSTRS